MAPSTDEELIREVIARWINATNEGNVAAILELMARDVVFLVCGQPPMRGRKAFALAMQAALQIGRVQCEAHIREITVVKDHAYCWNHLHVTRRLKNRRKHQLEGDVLSVFRKERSGRWVIWRDANLLGG